MSYDAWKLATPPEYEREDDDDEAPVLWYAGEDLIGDLMRAIERAEKGTDDE